MKRIADFIVNKRMILFVIVLLIAAVCGFLTLSLKTNTDMSKYLSQSSNMRQGIDLMTSQFPEEEIKASIRVMFDGLRSTEIDTIKKQLESIPYVGSVDYDQNDSAYNKGSHTLYIINTRYEYGSKEENSIERNLDDSFNSYDVIYQNNDVQSSEVTPLLLMSALLMALLVLLIMSKSWLEPVLFMATIGIAVLINLGTNCIFPYTSDLTSSVAPIIQLALSMDYSIILMNRYRQEKLNNCDKFQAMKSALFKAFASIISSSLTTVVGLLALVFLTFKIGPELGIVLAKGVFISMICVFTILPVLILWFDKGIERSKKPTPPMKMSLISKTSHKTRYVMPFLFIALFISFFIIQKGTGITFTEGITDPLAKIFPKSNTVVLLYNNNNEMGADKVTSKMTKDRKVTSINGYTNTLGKSLSASEMSKAMATLDKNNGIQNDLVKMVYFLRNGEAMPRLSLQDFLTFIKTNKYSKETVLTSGNIPTEMTGTDCGTMTLPQFTNFVLKQLANDKAYSSQFNQKTLSQLRKLKDYTNKKAITSKKNYREAANMLNIDVEKAKLLYSYYEASNSGYVAPAITLSEFCSFVQSKVVTNPILASAIDPNVASQFNTLASLTNKEFLTVAQPAETLADILGIDVAQVQVILALSGNASGSMSVSDIIFLIMTNKTIKGSIDSENLAQLERLNKIVQLVLSDAKLSSGEITTLTGIEPDRAKLLLTFFHVENGGFEKAHLLSLQQLINFIIDNSTIFEGFLGDQLNQLRQARIIINGSVNGTQYSPKAMSNLLGIKESQCQGIYLLHKYRNYDKALINAVVSGKTYSYSQMYELLSRQIKGLSKNDIEIAYICYGGENLSSGTSKMTIHQFVNYLAEDVLKDAPFGDYIDKSLEAQILSGQNTLSATASQMKGKTYSRIIFTSQYEEESEETMAYISKLNDLRLKYVGKDSYLVGTSTMVYEMEEGFDHDFSTITLITAIAIFLVVLLTFRNLVVPTLLTLLVQCGVYITVSAIGLIGGTVYYLALLIVQSILMGATIDYGIVFTNNYREKRQSLNRASALEAAYDNSIQTIMTSGSILVLVTGLLGIFSTAEVTSQVCLTISIGALISIALILLILPGVLDCFDRLVAGRRAVR